MRPRSPRDDFRRSRNLVVSVAFIVGLTALVVVSQSITNDPPLTQNELWAALAGDQVEEIRVYTNQWRADVRMKKDAPQELRGGDQDRIRKLILAPGDNDVGRLE